MAPLPVRKRVSSPHRRPPRALSLVRRYFVYARLKYNTYNDYLDLISSFIGDRAKHTTQPLTPK